VPAYAATGKPAAIVEGRFAAKDIIRVGAVDGVIKFGKG